MGGALGLAVLATLSTTRTNTLLHSGDSLSTSLVSGYHIAFTIGAILVIIGIVAAVFLLRSDGSAADEVQQPVAEFGEGEPAYLEEAA